MLSYFIAVRLTIIMIIITIIIIRLFKEDAYLTIFNLL